MDTPEQAELRRAVRLRAERDGYRPVARQVGMSPTGLRKFVGGSPGIPRTWEKVRSWYAREVEPSAAARKTAPVALDALVRFVEPDLQAEARRTVTDGLARLYGERGRPVPGWLAALDGALHAYEAALRRQVDGFATVTPIKGAAFVVMNPPVEGEPRDAVRHIAEHGVWHGDVFVPPHQIKSVRLGGML